MTLTAKEAYERRLVVLLKGGKQGHDPLPRTMLPALEKLDRHNKKRRFSVATRALNLAHVVNLGLFLRGRGRERFENATEEDLEAWQADFPGPATTLSVAISTVKKFYKVLEGDGKGRRRVPPEKVEVLERPGNGENGFDPEKAPLYREMARHVEEVLAALDHPRDRALVALTFDTGARRSEIADLKVGHVSLGEGYGDLTLNGKTGTREVRFVRAYPYLTTWLNHHPRPERDAFLWVALGKDGAEPLSERALNHVFERVRRLTGLPLTPHDLRHGRATEAAQLGWNEDLMRRFLGWSKASTMPSRYTHLAAQDAKDRVMQDAGISDKPTPEEKGLAPRICPQGHMNEASNMWCKVCGWPFTMEARTESEAVKDRLTELVEQIVEEKLRNALS